MTTKSKRGRPLGKNIEIEDSRGKKMICESGRRHAGDSRDYVGCVVKTKAGKPASATKRGGKKPTISEMFDTYEEKYGHPPKPSAKRRASSKKYPRNTVSVIKQFFEGEVLPTLKSNTTSKEPVGPHGYLYVEGNGFKKGIVWLTFGNHTMETINKAEKAILAKFPGVTVWFVPD